MNDLLSLEKNGSNLVDNIWNMIEFTHMPHTQEYCLQLVLEVVCYG